MLNLKNLVWGLIREVRPRQWIKNGAVFAGLIFTGGLDSNSLILISVKAFIIFCLATSSTYLINDIFDIERDRQHPFKKYRPIAAGIIPVPLAAILAIVMIMIALQQASTLTPSFFFAIVGYLVLQLFYSLILKHVILLDVMTIAAGFVLRIYAGVWAISGHLNVWFLLTITSFALFIAIGKRRSELTLLKNHDGKTRSTLIHYPETLLDTMTSMFANSTWLSYAMFTFFQPAILARPRVLNFLTDFNFQRAGETKYLMATVPLVIYGVMRYLYIIYEKKQGESPERVLLTDKPLLFTGILWLLMIVGIIYYLGA